ncbi:glycoside hydrolase family 16 protein [Sphingomonas adhaesiva]|uniref:glycoside hydrolase family 16 protein n=1 Tax=Sphingomonas adhaesiva TaxID=28212 RepID=UPI002FF478AF
MAMFPGRPTLLIGTAALALPVAAALLALVPPADHPQAAAARPLPSGALPPRIAAASLGKMTFEEEFRSLDAGTDQTRPARPHRWRTVNGYGGPDAADNRALSRTTLAVDRNYAGVGGKKPLGIDPFSTSADGLTITARKAPAALAPALFGRSWTSGLLTTKFSFAQRHGYFEAVMDIPVCEKGMWPAFWLLPTTLGWPLHGEIDAPEAIGDGKLYWSTVSKASGRKEETHAITKPSCERGFHAYGILWRPDRIGFYYDRALVGQAATPADYTEPMFMILNLTVGGSWPGEPPATTTSATMRVRSVRVWDGYR